MVALAGIGLSLVGRPHKASACSCAPGESWGLEVREANGEVIADGGLEGLRAVLATKPDQLFVVLNGEESVDLQRR